MLAWASSSTLPSSSPLTCRSSSWAVDQVPQHAVERRGQLLELVAGVDLGPLLDVAAADRVAHVAQVLERLDDHVAHDDVAATIARKTVMMAVRQQDGAVLGQIAARGFVGDVDAGHGDQIALGGRATVGEPHSADATALATVAYRTRRRPVG